MSWRENMPKKPKRDAREDPDPVPYKKKAVHPPVKKADHAHDWEPVVLTYFDKHKNFSGEKGFTGGMSSCRGRRCKVCGKLALGFPEGTEGVKETVFRFEVDFPDLPHCPVEDIWKLR